MHHTAAAAAHTCFTCFIPTLKCKTVAVYSCSSNPCTSGTEVDSAFSPSRCFLFSQNAARIVRALFEIALRKRWPAMTYRLLTLCKVIDKRLWAFAHPLRQFPSLSHIVLNRLEEKKLTVDKLKEMKKDEIGKNN